MHTHAYALHYIYNLFLEFTLLTYYYIITYSNVTYVHLHLCLCNLHAYVCLYIYYAYTYTNTHIPTPMINF